MNKPLLALGVTLATFAVFLLWSVAAVAQSEDAAALILVRLPTTTDFTPDQVTGVADVVMTPMTYDQSGLTGELIGYIFDASAGEITDMFELPVIFYMPEPGIAERRCSITYYQAGFELESGIPAYIMGDQGDTNCLGPVPTFYRAEP